MSNPDRNSRQPTANSSPPSMWGAKKIVDGALCRQCRRCLKWFHIGWIAYHGCKACKPRSR